MMLSLTTLPAPETQRLVGVRSLPIPGPALAPVLVVERWPSTMGTPILQWAPRHFCSTPAARRTPPLELTRWSITMGAATTMLWAVLRFLTTSTEAKTEH